MNSYGKTLFIAGLTAATLGLAHKANEVVRSREAQVLALLGEGGKAKVLDWYRHTRAGSRGSGKHEIIDIEFLPDGTIALRFRDVIFDGMQGEANCKGEGDRKGEGTGITCVTI